MRKKGLSLVYPDEVKRLALRQFVVLGILSLASGLLFVLNPSMSVNIVVTIAAVFLFVIGILQLFDFLRAEEDRRISGPHLATALCAFSAGGYFLREGKAVAAIIGLLVALLLMYHGGYHMQQSLMQWRSGFQRWWVSLLFSLAAIAAGLYAIIGSKAVDETFLRLLGIFLLAAAIFDGYGVLTTGAVIAQYEAKKQRGMVEESAGSLQERK